MRRDYKGPGLSCVVATRHWLWCDGEARKWLWYVNSKNNKGTYSKYVVTGATDSVYPLNNDVPMEEAASCFVNPYMTLAILDTAKFCGSKALVHASAA